LVVVTQVARLFRKRLSLANLLGGSLFWWALFLVAISLLLPGGSYLFAWPLLFSMAVLFFALRSKQAEETLKKPLALLVSAVPVVMIFAALTHILFIFEPVSMGPYLMAIVVFGLALLVPHLEVIADVRRGFLPLVTVAAAVVLLIVSAVNTQFDKAHPQADNLFYLMNADTGKSSWVSYYAPDAWNKQVMTQVSKMKFKDLGPVNFDLNVYASPAPVSQVEPAQVSVLSDTTSGEERTLHLKVTSPQQANTTLLFFNGATVTQATMNGRVLPNTLVPQSSALRIWNTGYPDGGFDVTVKVKGNGKLSLSVFDIIPTLPGELSASLKPRPDNIMPGPDFDQSTIVEKTFPL
jgi:hypothetical protein